MVSVGSYRNNISGMSSNDCNGRSSMTGPIKLPHRVYTVGNIFVAPRNARERGFFKFEICPWFNEQKYENIHFLEK